MFVVCVSQTREMDRKKGRPEINYEVTSEDA
jgi:hypothetical protein